MPNEVKIERVTPAQAKEILATNTVNRNIRENRVIQYQRDMENGRWTFCPQPIVINKDGELIDGQHRLTAQIGANKTISWVVIRKVDNEVQKTIDTNAPRSLADMLHMEGHTYSHTTGAVARLALQLQTGRISGSNKNAGASNLEVFQFIEQHPEVVHSAKVAHTTSITSGMVQCPPSPLGAAHWWISQHAGIEAADDFIQRIGSLVGEEAGSPVLALAKRLNELARQRTRIERRWILFAILKAWNYDVRGMKVNKISTTTRSGEYVVVTPLVPGQVTESDLAEDEAS